MEKLQTENLQLKNLRAGMKERGIDIYIVPTSDFHESEYVGEHFKARQFLTGFTGSAGTAAVTMTEAGLWTDARYFLQAERQLEGSGFELYRMGEENVPTLMEYVKEKLPEMGKIGFDGRVINGSLGSSFQKLAEDKRGSLLVEEDLVDQIWKDRPSLSCRPAWLLGPEISGESTASKLKRIRAVMEEKKADLHITTSVCDIAWILNVRGQDVTCLPVVLSYLAVYADRCIWFVQEKALSDELSAYLKENGIEVLPYEGIYEYVKRIPAGTSLLMNVSAVNYRLCSTIPQEVTIINEADPSVSMKAVKNEKEIRNNYLAHVKDGAAVCRFMHWLKTNVGKVPMTEISVSDRLEEFRREQEGFLDLSFHTISGYAAHGAIVHYSATKETDIPLKAEGFLLVDSGAHYLGGTTDITRTFALGPVTEEMKTDFTRVCRSMLSLANAKFLYGCTGLSLDILARTPLWEAGMDYKHGTGHGVGYMLNVHEGPQGFRWRNTGRSEAGILEEGMITSDEPGIYLAGKYGIRTENEILCRKGEKNEYGQFMYFEQQTFVPIDLDAIDPEQMSTKERGWLNAYHKLVYETVAPLLTEEERSWLAEYTREI